MAKATTKGKSVPAPVKKSEPPAKKASSAVAVPATDEEFEKLLSADAGKNKGTSSKTEDNLVPLVYILQSNSPQVNKRSDAYIEGAEAGDIWLRHAAEPIVKGDEGVVFLPCYFFKDYVEWIPRDDGGGMVGRHPELPEEAEVQHDEKRPNRVINKMPNGNDLILTANHAGFVITDEGRALPYMIPLKSTGLTVSRAWMFMMNQKLSVEGKPLASYSHKYRLTTKHRKNKEGEWFVLDVTDEGRLTAADKELYMMGRALEAAFASGEKRGEEEVQAGQTGPSTGGDDNDTM
jgi:hypothetical protein